MRFHLVINDVHMGLGHHGLTELAKKLKADPSKLEAEQLLLFINGAKDKLKIMGRKGTAIGYYKHPRGKITMEALQYIPQAFGAKGTVDLDSAIKKALELQLLRKGYDRGKRPSPLDVAKALRA
jgi:hypothetical protein